MKKKKPKTLFMLSVCLVVHFPFGAQQIQNVWAIQPFQDLPQARDFWGVRTSFDEVVSQLKLDN